MTRSSHVALGAIVASIWAALLISLCTEDRSSADQENSPALQAAVDLAKRFEGLSLVPYHDPDGWITIGYGHKIAGALRHGVLSSYSAIDTTTALMWLRIDMRVACGVVSRNVGVSLTPNEMAALCDFVFNEGAGRFVESTLLRKLNEGDKAAVPGELRRWIYGDGHVLEGLVRRREAEARLWESDQ